ncbi:MAG: DUF3347 domain-containing protein [Bacteroidota bacterium]|nr:DUF3347 domain-containing protein [Bacteroidota bacterium]
MKTKSFHFTLLFAATAFAFLSNCSGNTKEDATEGHEGHASHEHANETTPAEASKPTFEVDHKFQEQLSSLFAAYIDLKDAFVSSDAKNIQLKASTTNDVLAGVDMNLLTGAAHNDWMNYVTHIKKAIVEIQSGTDIEAQRESFSTLSDNLYKSAKAFGLGGEEAFYTYCPMAFNNEGAYWLSDNKTIRNPYFGDKMLTCGQVKETLK